MEKQCERPGSRIRPQVARWFELYVPRDETVYAVEALAKSGEVQLELDRRLVDPLDVAPIREAIKGLEGFCRQHRIALPSHDTSSSQLDASPEETVRRAVDYVHHWSQHYFALEEQLKAAQGERENLVLLSRLLEAMEGDDGLERFAHASDFLCKGVYACPGGRVEVPRLDGVFSESIVQRDLEFIVLAGPPQACARVEELFESTACIQVTIPEWLPPGLQRQREAAAGRLAELDRHIRETVAETDRHRRSPRLKEVLANVSVLKWFIENAPKLGAKRRFCHVTGWTTLQGGDAIERLLGEAGVHSVTRYPQPPIGVLPPLQTLEHWWCRPFEIFNALVQSPGRGEIDPRLVIPLVVPLLFGFMFPDVGHGFVILLLGVGLSLYRPLYRFLIPCGAAAMGFGLLFGEMFGIEGLLPAYWFHPLDEPLRILFISLLFGAGLMLIGMIFSGIEAYWRGELRGWLLVDASVLTLYLSLLAAVFLPDALWLVPPGLAWYLAGSLMAQARRSLRDLPAILGHLVQSAYELAVNSFSFIRVGAFALAHAGLTSAIITVAEGFETPWAHGVMLVVGHLLVIAIEGLVVFIQTSRLLLFEFFTRFLHAEGRVFQPLRLPRPSRG